jgi:hypothetical protein
MPLSVDDVTYFTLNEVAEAAGVRRETVWRWRRAGKVPSGREYRDRERLFTQPELDEICAYANRLGPEEPTDPAQLRLFNNLREGTA